MSAAAPAEASIADQARKTTSLSGYTDTATTRYTVSAGDLLKQMDLVGQATENLVTMPTAVGATGQCAIRARQTFSTWYERTRCGIQSSS